VAKGTVIEMSSIGGFQIRCFEFERRWPIGFQVYLKFKHKNTFTADISKKMKRIPNCSTVNCTKYLANFLKTNFRLMAYSTQLNGVDPTCDLLYSDKFIEFNFYKWTFEAI
jgi:hypothetical protein